MSDVIISCDPTVTREIIAFVTDRHRKTVSEPALATPRDQRLLALMSEFTSCRQIALQLGVPVPAIKLRLIGLYRRQGVGQGIAIQG